MINADYIPCKSRGQLSRVSVEPALQVQEVVIKSKTSAQAVALHLTLFLVNLSSISCAKVVGVNSY